MTSRNAASRREHYDTPDAEPRSSTMVSQRTSESVLGIPARQYLEMVRTTPTLPRKRVGKLVLVRVSDVLALVQADGQ